MSLKANQRLPFDAAIVVQDLRCRQVEDVNPIAQWLHDAGVKPWELPKILHLPRESAVELCSIIVVSSDGYPMYLQHWQLEARPFENTSDARYYYPGEMQNKVCYLNCATRWRVGKVLCFWQALQVLGNRF